VELAQREFERKKMADGGSDARGQMIPRLPTKAERQVHELTHWPFADWCESCVAARARSDPHRLQGSLRAEGKSEYPVVQWISATPEVLRSQRRLTKKTCVFMEEM
jgi:hypothetical protein